MVLRASGWLFPSLSHKFSREAAILDGQTGHQKITAAILLDPLEHPRSSYFSIWLQDLLHRHKLHFAALRLSAICSC